jgi:hypothetical protein
VRAGGSNAPLVQPPMIMQRLDGTPGRRSDA